MLWAKTVFGCFHLKKNSVHPKLNYLRIISHITGYAIRISESILNYNRKWIEPNDGFLSCTFPFAIQKKQFPHIYKMNACFERKYNKSRMCKILKIKFLIYFSQNIVQYRNDNVFIICLRELFSFLFILCARLASSSFGGQTSRKIDESFFPCYIYTIA